MMHTISAAIREVKKCEAISMQSSRIVRMRMRPVSASCSVQPRKKSMMEKLTLLAIIPARVL